MTVGFGFTPNLLTFQLLGRKRSRAVCYVADGKFTAGREFHPALKIDQN